MTNEEKKIGRIVPSGAYAGTEKGAWWRGRRRVS